jgi:hypothetical protein
MAANTVLQLTFKRQDLKTTTMSITDPKVGLTVEEVNTAMAGIIEKAIFAPEGSLLESKVRAELVITDKSAFTMS